MNSNNNKNNNNNNIDPKNISIYDMELMKSNVGIEKKLFEFY